jgi:CheY-like chemotaxis protein
VPKKILLADDSQTFLSFYETVFRRLGAEVVRATAGPEAVALAWKEKPDLILLDLEMPGMSGAECTRLLKQDPTCAHIPIILVTRHISERDLDTMMRSGCEEVLAKPVSALQLRQVMARHLK